MKKHLLFFLLLVSAVGSAQVITIPDPEFKAYLLTAQGKNSAGQTILINTNQDNEIQISEALAVWEIIINDPTYSIVSVQGIEAFSNLRDLQFRNCYQLGSSGTEVNLTQLSNLEKLSIISSAYYAGTDYLSIYGLMSLKELVIDDSFAEPAWLNVTGLHNLEKLTLNINFINDLEWQVLQGLKELYLSEINLTTIDLSNNLSLEIAELNFLNGLTEEINLGYKPNLYNLEINTYGTLIEYLDLSGCTALTNLNVSYTSAGTRFLNLKNNISNYQELELEFESDAENPLYICVDEGNEGLLPESDEDNTQMFVSTYCNFTPGGTYNTLSGTFTYDSDNNGCDTNDNIITNTRLDIVTENEEEFSVFSNNSGVYNFYSGAGTFTLTPGIENSDWFIATPSSTSVTFTDDNNNINIQNFCVTANGVHPDLEVVVASGGAQPGFDAYYTVTFKNKGNQQLSGVITLTYDDTVLDFLNAYNGGTDTAGTISWNYSNLQPFESRQVAAVLNVNSPMETPAVNIDDILNFTATITPTAGDETPADNTFNLNQIVTGSYDPNDITCLEGESVTPELIGEYLHYNINFENTGNAPATFIAIKNTLNPEQFDLSTLQLLYASHDVETRLSGNELEFYFGDINLAANGGKGNVVYKIKTNNTLQVNDDVAQQANIYFDYNWPIQTNEAVTTFETLSSGIHTKDNSIKLYPNPAKGIVTITAGTDIESVEMYDMQGRLLQVSHTATLDITQRQSGIYFVKVTTEKGSKVEKLVKE